MTASVTALLRCPVCGAAGEKTADGKSFFAMESGGIATISPKAATSILAATAKRGTQKRRCAPEARFSRRATMRLFPIV